MSTITPQQNQSDASSIQQQQQQSASSSASVPSWPSEGVPRLMKALEWTGKESVRVAEREVPRVLVPTDAIIRITTTTICGSDLHMYHNAVKGMQKGDILGHEFVGVVDAVGSAVSKFKVGDRVVVSAAISCNSCYYCVNGLFSCCDNTNPSTEMQSLYGHRTAGLFGYTHLTGGYPGGQAEYTRVPLADNNLLRIPDGIADEKVINLCDVACTAWHANECGAVAPGHVVCIWGCGPIGLMSAAWARFRGAARVIVIDGDSYRLDFARSRLGVEAIDFTKQNVVETIQQLVPGGPDVCIEAAGFRFARSVTQRLQQTVGLQTDSAEIITEIVRCCRKGGTLALIGDYFAMANQFPIGHIMEKGITLRGSQVHVQRYWQLLMDYIVSGDFDPSFILTHVVPFEKMSEAYENFDKHLHGIIKLDIKTEFGRQMSLGDPRANIAAQPFSQSFLAGQPSRAALLLRDRRAHGLSGEITGLTHSLSTPQLLVPHETEAVATRLHKLALGLSDVGLKAGEQPLEKSDIIRTENIDAGKTAPPEARPGLAV